MSSSTETEKEHHARLSRESYQRRKVQTALRRKEQRDAKKRGVTLPHLRRNLPQQNVLNDDENEAINGLLNLSINTPPPTPTPVITEQQQQQTEDNNRRDKNIIIQTNNEIPELTEREKKQVEKQIRENSKRIQELKQQTQQQQQPTQTQGNDTSTTKISKGKKTSKSNNEEVINTYENLITKLTEYGKEKNEADGTLVRYRNDLEKDFDILGVDLNEDLRPVLLDFDNVKNKIENAKQIKDPTKIYAYSTILGHVQILAKIIRLFMLPKGFPKDIYDKYNEWFEYRNALVQADRGLRRIRDDETLMSFKNYLELIKDKFGKDSKEYLVGSLYSEMNVRDNFPKMTIEPSESTANKKNENLLIVPTNPNEKITLILNRFKTQKAGQFKDDLSLELSQLTREYIAKHNIQYGGYIFSDSSLSKFVGDMNKAIKNNKGAINLLRQQKATDDVLDPNATPESIVASARRSQHSVNTHFTYVRKQKK